MNLQPDDNNPTRRSLVSRLRRWDDQASWDEFFNMYWRLIYSVAIKAGLTDQEAEDVVQETVIGVAKKMGEFRYDPTVCSFRGWLLHVTRLRIQDQFRKRLPTFSHRKRATAPKDFRMETGTRHQLHLAINRHVDILVRPGPEIA